MSSQAPSEPYENRHVRRALGHFIVGKGMGAVIGAGWLLLLVRVISAREYGLYVGFVAYLELFNLLSNVGLSPISERFVPQYNVKGSEPLLRALIFKLVQLRILVVCALSGAIALLAPMIAPLAGFGDAAAAFAIFAIVVAVESIARFIETIFDSLLFQGRSQISLMTRTGLRLAFVFVATRGGAVLDLHRLVTLEALAYSTGLLMTLLLAWRTQRDSLQAARIAMPLRPLLAFALPVYFSQILGSLIGIDVVKLLVLQTTGAQASAVFGFCASLAWLLQRYLPSFLLVGLVRPLIVHATVAADGGVRLQRILAVLVKVNALAIGLALAVCLAAADQVIAALSGGKFTEHGAFLTLLVLYTFTQTLRAIFGYVALAQGEGRAMLIAHLPSALVLLAGAVASLYCGLYTYCVALILMDVVWTYFVRHLGAARVAAVLRVPLLPWKGLLRVAGMISVGWLAGALVMQSMPLAWTAWAQAFSVGVVVSLAFLVAGVLLRPFPAPEWNAMVRMLPRQFSFLTR